MEEGRGVGEEVRRMGEEVRRRLLPGLESPRRMLERMEAPRFAGNLKQGYFVSSSSSSSTSSSTSSASSTTPRLRPGRREGREGEEYFVVEVAAQLKHSFLYTNSQKLLSRKRT